MEGEKKFESIFETASQEIENYLAQDSDNPQDMDRVVEAVLQSLAFTEPLPGQLVKSTNDLRERFAKIRQEYLDADTDQERKIAKMRIRNGFANYLELMKNLKNK